MNDEERQMLEEIHERVRTLNGWHEVIEAWRIGIDREAATFKERMDWVIRLMWAVFALGISHIVQAFFLK